MIRSRNCKSSQHEQIDPKLNHCFDKGVLNKLCIFIYIQMYLYTIFTMIFGSQHSGLYPPLLLSKCGSLDHAGCGSRKTCNQNQQWAQFVLQSTNICRYGNIYLYIDNFKNGKPWVVHIYVIQCYWRVSYSGLYRCRVAFCFLVV